MGEEHDKITDVPDPAAFINFESHTDAAGMLIGLGFLDVLKSPSYCATDLCDAVNGLLKERGVCAMDMTTAIPDTSQAAYKALTIAGFNAAASCRKDPKAVFLVLRTELNTPSFLLGHHWSLVQAIGKEMADSQIRKSPTPGALIIFRDRQVWLPSSVLTATPEIVAKLIAQEVTSDESLFSCCMCGKTFVESREDAFIRVSEMGVAPCGKMFCRACVEAHVKETGTLPDFLQ